MKNITIYICIIGLLMIISVASLEQSVDKNYLTSAFCDGLPDCSTHSTGL